MKFKKTDLIELMDLNKVGEETSGEDGGLILKLVEESDWTSDGKYENKDWIFEHAGKFYSLSDTRTGSYHTDYFHGCEDWAVEEDCIEVVKVEVVKHEWRVKK